jgi:NADPH-dependent glutamate synthase beta subunit-like oxidoreductase
MLALGIPEHRLPKKTLNADIEAIKSSGVTIKTNQTLGKDFSLDDLFRQGYKAVFIATGAYKSWKLGKRLKSVKEWGSSGAETPLSIRLGWRTDSPDVRK